MYKMKKQFFIKSVLITCLLVVALVNCYRKSSETKWDLSSPDNNLRIVVESDGNKLFYLVEKNKDSKYVTVVEKSPLGIVRKDGDFSSNLNFKSKGEIKIIDEQYQMITGKQSVCRNNAQELVLNFTNENHSEMELILRAYNDGVAFRYRFPENSNEIYWVTNEFTGFKIPVNGKAWIMPYEKPSEWGPAYEEYYTNAIDIGSPSGNDAGWAFPLLFNSQGMWMLITEAGLDTTFYGAHIAQNADSGLYKIALPNAGEGLGTGTVEASSTLPWSTPWRLIVVGETPATIIENNLVYNLSEPSRIKDISWIKPGRVSWSWWSDHTSPRDVNKLKQYVDLSKDMTWEYSLVDANWNIMKVGNIDELNKYAKEKGVGLLLWYNSGGPHTSVTEQPRDKMNDRTIRRAEMKKLEEWGIKGVKVDFFQSDKQHVISLYQQILKDAADFHLLVDFHGCTLPRGWARTYPNLMSMEGVKGAEQYTWDVRFAENACVYSTIEPFTRNAVGSMDYTPVTFSDYSEKTAHTTTYAHELALSVVFESGLQHFADRVSAYKSVPDYVQEFLKNVPVAWDETKYISGEPGKFIVIARRKGNNWYIAGIEGEKDPKSLAFNLPFITEGNYKCELIMDGSDSRSFSNVQQNFSSGDTLNVTMRSKGGFACLLTKE